MPDGVWINPEVDGDAEDMLVAFCSGCGDITEFGPCPTDQPEAYARHVEDQAVAKARKEGACLTCGGRGKIPMMEADVTCSRCGGTRLDPGRHESWWPYPSLAGLK